MHHNRFLTIHQLELEVGPICNHHHLLGAMGLVVEDLELDCWVVL
jgi:hypothetical protein